MFRTNPSSNADGKRQAVFWSHNAKWLQITRISSAWRMKPWRVKCKHMKWLCCPSLSPFNTLGVKTTFRPKVWVLAQSFFFFFTSTLLKRRVLYWNQWYRTFPLHKREKVSGKRLFELFKCSSHQENNFFFKELFNERFFEEPKWFFNTAKTSFWNLYF